MRPVTIARNYAEALFQLGEESGRTTEYADLLDAVAHAIETTPRIEAVLMSPRITKAAKSQILAQALPEAPREFVLFLQSVVKRGRQRLFGMMASEFLALLDIKLDRVRAKVTVAREVDDKLRKKIAQDLTKAIGKQVLPDFDVDPDILGGVIVRVGDRVYDGSVRRRLVRLRRQLLAR
ncbi:MAG TPA: ATP synthase F1 subunit delta [Gemmatimonadales bacterium]|nr:ATP synthase F1 subunit delta [Gemmatimonadales bacterium]